MRLIFFKIYPFGYLLFNIIALIVGAYDCEYMLHPSSGFSLYTMTALLLNSCFGVYKRIFSDKYRAMLIFLALTPFIEQINVFYPIENVAKYCMTLAFTGIAFISGLLTMLAMLQNGKEKTK